MDHQTRPQDSDPSNNRRPCGFTASTVSINHPATPKNGRRLREKEKERTKLRERHRRAITGRILAGLRQYGNFPLPARADMNDVLTALARDAGWIVEADGTTYRSSVSMPSLVRATPQPQLIPFKATLDSEPSLLRIEESLSPASIDSVLAADHGDFKTEKYGSVSPNNSSDHTMLGAAIADGNFGGTTYIPVYVSLQTGIVNNYCQMVDPEALRQELGHLKALNIDGVVVDCWWGIVEAWVPQKYIWTGYRDVFTIIREYQLKLQVVMAFHEHGGTETSSMSITLPKWVLEIGKDNQDIFFTDREGRRNTEHLSWGIDKERVLNGRTCIEVYFDFMRSFRMEFNDLFEEGLISAVEIGFGVNGELKYTSFPERMGWRYPGIGEFQCYDKYMQRSLRQAAELRGHLSWAKGPDNAGYYNSRPHETGFFCDHGDYDGYHGRFFVQWYAQTLIDHADLVLSLAKLAFEGIQLIVKIPSVYWWYKSRSHAAEITAGYYNPANRDGYSPIFNMLKKHSVTMKFTSPNMLTSSLENDDALADPEGLNQQILNCAWEHELSVAGQSVVPFHDREACNRLLETAKPTKDPDHHHFSFFTCQPLTYISMQEDMFLLELHDLIKSMHGEVSNNVGLEP